MKPCFDTVGTGLSFIPFCTPSPKVSPDTDAAGGNPLSCLQALVGSDVFFGPSIFSRVLLCSESMLGALPVLTKVLRLILRSGKLSTFVTARRPCYPCWEIVE